MNDLQKKKIMTQSHIMKPVQFEATDAVYFAF